MYPTIALVLTFSLAQISFSQIFVSRTALYLPNQKLSADSLDETGVMANVSFNADIQRGGFSTNGEQAWSYRLGGVAELYRWSNGTSLNLSGFHELVSNPFNDIGFNPRQALWMEQLSLSSGNTFNYEVGFSHRCKHEVDNGDDSRGDSAAGGGSMKRVVLLSGPFLQVQSQENLSSDLTANWCARADYFAIRADYRRPSTDSSFLWNDLGGAVSLAGKLSARLSSITLFVRFVGSAFLFDRSTVNKTSPVQARAECGVSLVGKRGVITLFTSWEYWHDDMSSPRPQASRVLAVGIRFSGEGFW